MQRRRIPESAVFFLLAVSVAASVCTGSVNIPLSDVFKVLSGMSDAEDSLSYIVLNMRIPRTVCCIFAGGILALCGMMFQDVFRNPMADSYILGISSGSSLMVAVGIITGLSSSCGLSTPFLSFAGGITASALLFMFSSFNPFSVLLTGVAMNFFLSSLTTLFIFLDRRHADSVLFWTMGSMSSSSWERSAILFAVFAAVLAVCIKESNAMDVMLMDDSTALSSGVDVRKLRIALLIVASAGTAVVVSYCGVIGFVGLMSPHIVRLLCGPSHRRLSVIAPASGACILILSDILARIVVSPGELPVGVVTAVIGAPVFFIILKRRHSWVLL